MMKRLLFCLMCLLPAACSVTRVGVRDMDLVPVDAGGYQIATYQHITDDKAPVHIYIEGDGYAFDAWGRPTDNPTPRGTFMRDLAARDSAKNVVYVARPCQYIMSSVCHRNDWTDGRFSQQIVDAMATVIKQIAQSRPVILVGYSGGAMISGLIILQKTDIDVKKWITIAGVLNHTDWTEYFGDAPLELSVDMTQLPDVPQVHYIAYGDKVVPNRLSRQWVSPDKLTVVHGATHTYFPNIVLDFKY